MENEKEICIYGEFEMVRYFDRKKPESFTIKKGITEGRVWIERKSGEGGDFDSAEFYDLVEKLYNERF